MGRNMGKPMITTSVRISPEYHQLCVKNFISFSHAMRVGVSLLLAEMGTVGYDNKLNIVREKIRISEELIKYIKKFGELKEE